MPGDCGLQARCLGANLRLTSSIGISMSRPRPKAASQAGIDSGAKRCASASGGTAAASNKASSVPAIIQPVTSGSRENIARQPVRSERLGRISLALALTSATNTAVRA